MAAARGVRTTWEGQGMAWEEEGGRKKGRKEGAMLVKCGTHKLSDPCNLLPHQLHGKYLNLNCL